MSLEKKIAQNVAQPIFCQNEHITCTVEKSSPRNSAAFVVFKKLPKRKRPSNLPNLVTLKLMS
jgi:hypothetical protein